MQARHLEDLFNVLTCLAILQCNASAEAPVRFTIKRGVRPPATLVTASQQKAHYILPSSILLRVYSHESYYIKEAWQGCNHEYLASQKCHVLGLCR